MRTRGHAAPLHLHPPHSLPLGLGSCRREPSPCLESGPGAPGRHSRPWTPSATRSFGGVCLRLWVHPSGSYPEVPGSCELPPLTGRAVAGCPPSWCICGLMQCSYEAWYTLAAAQMEKSEHRLRRGGNGGAVCTGPQEPWGKRGRGGPTPAGQAQGRGHLSLVSVSMSAAALPHGQRPGSEGLCSRRPRPPDGSLHQRCFQDNFPSVPAGSPPPSCVRSPGHRISPELPSILLRPFIPASRLPRSLPHITAPDVAGRPESPVCSHGVRGVRDHMASPPSGTPRLVESVTHNRSQMKRRPALLVPR